MGIMAVGLGGFDEGVEKGGGSSAAGVSANSQFLRPMMKGRMARSQALLPMAGRPASR
jgi:hypothetical protein